MSAQPSTPPRSGPAPRCSSWGWGSGAGGCAGARIAGAARDRLRTGRRAACACARHGATAAVDPTKTDLREVVMDLTGGAGVDYAFEAAGSGVSCRAVSNSPVSAARSSWSGAADRGHRHHRRCRHLHDDGKAHPVEPARWLLAGARHPTTHRLLAEGRLDLGGLVTRRLDLAEVNEGIRLLRETDGVRTVVDVAQRHEFLDDLVNRRCRSDPSGSSVNETGTPSASPRRPWR